MADILLTFFRATLPNELADVLKDVLELTQTGDFRSVLELPEVQILLGHNDNEVTKDANREDFGLWSDYIFHRLGLILSKRNEDHGTPARETAAYRQHYFFVVAVASLYAFIQSTVTGPPLPFKSEAALFPEDISQNVAKLKKTRADLLASLSIDGVAAYKLTPNIELLCLAQTILICPPVQKNVDLSAWARLRANFVHQRLLSEPAPSLQTTIYNDLKIVENSIISSEKIQEPQDLPANFLLERAAVNTHHGLDKNAKRDLDQATSERKFEFALTGLMGKRTKFQQKDTSQLLVLARSAGSQTNGTATNEASRPKALDLNDDTLLESISFTADTASVEVKDESALPVSLTSMDPSNQPLLDPLDSVILLSLAESIKNTNPADGLTREETMPYATRVLEGGSSNWQVYTQALLVRSRIEGYRSRTMERGLLQLQALVDQVIAETSGDTTTDAETGEKVTSFLPQAREGESASVAERLQYVFPLCSPSRWELEAELAARWVHIGGLRSALEIYERLEMWAEAALCYAATEKEDKARKMVRKQLFHATINDEAVDEEAKTWDGPARDPPPAEAPRLYCILGDIDRDLSMYEKAWEVSGQRYARAQRSLGQNYIAQHDYEKAAEAYRLSLKINALYHPAWFALGCAYLELKEFKKAVEAFSRCVQLDDQDAEAWSNLAAALLHLRPKAKIEGDDEAEDFDSGRVTNHPRTDALKAFKRAANIKHDNHRIWNNVLAVAASTNPPSWSDVVTAQRRICEIRGSTDGEKCVDAEILDMMVKDVVQSEQQFDISRPGLSRFVNELIEKHVKPLITFSPKLWNVLATFYMHTSRPNSALECHEKAWRAVTSQPKWESGTESDWNAVADQTIDLVDAYETLGPREKTEGLAAGSGELVAKDWKFKARSAIRSVMGKGKENWEDSAGWDKLKERSDDLKGRD